MPFQKFVLLIAMVGFVPMVSFNLLLDYYKKPTTMTTNQSKTAYLD